MDDALWGWVREAGELAASGLALLLVILWARAFARRLAAAEAQLSAHEAQSTADRSSLHTGQDSLRAQLLRLQEATDRQTATLELLARRLDMDQLADGIVARLRPDASQQVNIGRVRAARDAHLSTEQGGRE